MSHVEYRTSYQLTLTTKGRHNIDDAEITATKQVPLKQRNLKIMNRRQILDRSAYPQAASLSQHANPHIKELYENLMAAKDVHSKKKQLRSPANSFRRAYIIRRKSSSLRRRRSQLGLYKYKGGANKTSANLTVKIDSPDQSDEETLNDTTHKETLNNGSTNPTSADTKTKERTFFSKQGPRDSFERESSVILNAEPNGSAFKRSDESFSKESILRQGSADDGRQKKDIAKRVGIVLPNQKREDNKLSLNTLSTHKTGIKSKIFFFEAKSPSALTSTTFQLPGSTEETRNTRTSTNETSVPKSPFKLSPSPFKLSAGSSLGTRNTSLSSVDTSVPKSPLALSPRPLKLSLGSAVPEKRASVSVSDSRVPLSPSSLSTTPRTLSPGFRGETKNRNDRTDCLWYVDDIDASSVCSKSNHEYLNGTHEKHSTSDKRISTGSDKRNSNSTEEDADEHIRCVTKFKYYELQRLVERLKQKLQEQCAEDSDTHSYCIPKYKYDALQQEFESLKEKLQEKNGASDTDFVAAEVIKRRVQYVKSVNVRTRRSIRKTKEFLAKTYPQLFEYALVVGLRSAPGTDGYKPYVKHKFPVTIDSNVCVPQFCFPDALQYNPPPDSNSESYSFVLTKLDGERVYGYCRRYTPPTSSLQEVVCIVSPLDASEMYNKLLDKIEEYRISSMYLAKELIKDAFGQTLPPPGRVVNIQTNDARGDLQVISINRPSDGCRENVNFEYLLNNFDTELMTKVFGSLLMERRVLLCSNSLGCLTHTAHTLVALLYPFHWQHIYIPILPLDMIDVCASPTPYLIGILSSHLPQVLQDEEILEEVLIVDLDTEEFVRSIGDEATLLPKKLQKSLKLALTKTDDESESQMTSEAFLKLFCDIMGHFQQHISRDENDEKVFDTGGFCENVYSKGIGQVLEWFTKTQMFEVFITNQLEKGPFGEEDLFMSYLMEYQRSNPVGLGKKIRRFGKNIKNKFG